MYTGWIQSSLTIFSGTIYAHRPIKLIDFLPRIRSMLVISPLNTWKPHQHSNPTYNSRLFHQGTLQCLQSPCPKKSQTPPLPLVMNAHTMYRLQMAPTESVPTPCPYLSDKHLFSFIQPSVVVYCGLRAAFTPGHWGSAPVALISVFRSWGEWTVTKDAHRVYTA